MSTPVSGCSVVKATKSEEGYQELLRIMKINKKYGHWSYFPCACGSCVEPTNEELDRLNVRLGEDLKGIVYESMSGAQGPIGKEIP